MSQTIRLGIRHLFTTISAFKEKDGLKNPEASEGVPCCFKVMCFDAAQSNLPTSGGRCRGGYRLVLLQRPRLRRSSAT